MGLSFSTKLYSILKINFGRSFCNKYLLQFKYSQQRNDNLPQRASKQFSLLDLAWFYHNTKPRFPFAKYVIAHGRKEAKIIPKILFRVPSD
jgi:hypothetical protein